jgi:predicted dehydrogenase
LGGGALWDVGAYCVNALRWYMRAEPSWVVGWADRVSADAVDRRSGGLLDFGDGRLGEFFCAMDTFGGGQVEILGERGKLTIPLAFRLRATARELELRVETAEGARAEVFPYHNQYEAELDAFATAVRSGGPAPIPTADAVRNVATLAALRASWTSGPRALG